MSDGNGDSIKRLLDNHPRLAGVLFAALLALTQVGNAAAACAATID